MTTHALRIIEAPDGCRVHLGDVPHRVRPAVIAALQHGRSAR